MSSSQPTCGYFYNVSGPTFYGFATPIYPSNAPSKISIIWNEPQSGFLNFTFYLPRGAGLLEPGTIPYCFYNQKVWTIPNIYYIFSLSVAIYTTHVPAYFSIQFDDQTFSVSQIIQRDLSTDCCQQIGGYVTGVELNNGLELYATCCDSFGLVDVGATQIPLGGGCDCGGCFFSTNCFPATTPTPSPPCSLPKFLNLPVLSPPAPKSTISSSLWNSIVNNIYSAYNSLLKIKSALSLANYANLLNSAYTIYDALYTPTPYVFTPLLTAKKGVPLTANDFNALVNALEQVYSELRQPLPYKISPEFPDSIVKSETFAKIVNNLNVLRQSALQSVLLTSTTGAELNNLPQNFAGQNIFVCSISNNATLSGNITIENLLIVQIPGTLTIGGNTSITRLIAQNMNGTLILQNSANVHDITIGTLSGAFGITNFASVQNLFINNIPAGGQLIISGNAFVQNLQVNSCQSGSIVIEDYAIVNNLQGQASQCI